MTFSSYGQAVFFFDISVKENGEIQIYWQDLIIWGWLFPAYSPKEEFAS